MPDTIEISLPHSNTEIPVHLFSDGALFWPEGQTLVITDPHFGRADPFQQAGISVPPQVHESDLARLTKLINACEATVLIVLGDFYHLHRGQNEIAISTLTTWRSQHAELEIVIVQGKNSTQAAPSPVDLELDLVTLEAPFAAGPFICHHRPQLKASKEGYILAGYLHPYVVMRNRDGSRLRLASFVVGPHQTVLPIFGGSTGGAAYAASMNERLFVTSEGEIFEIPTSRQRVVKRSRR